METMNAGTSEFDTELSIVDMLRYSIEHADRNLAFNQSYLLEVWILFFWKQLGLFGNYVIPYCLDICYYNLYSIVLFVHSMMILFLIFQ